MGFSIDYGSPGILSAILIVFGVAAVGIVAYFMLSAAKGAHDEVEEAEAEETGEDEPLR